MPEDSQRKAARKSVRDAQRRFDRESTKTQRARQKAFMDAQREGLSLREIAEEVGLHRSAPGVDSEAARPGGSGHDPFDPPQQLVDRDGEGEGELDQVVGARQALPHLHVADVGPVKRSEPAQLLLGEARAAAGLPQVPAEPLGDLPVPEPAVHQAASKRASKWTAG